MSVIKDQIENLESIKIHTKSISDYMSKPHLTQENRDYIETLCNYINETVDKEISELSN